MNKNVNQLIPVADFLGAVLGENTEIIVHDLTNYDHSVVHIINGHISNRKIGDSITDLMLNFITTQSKGDQQFICKYNSKTADGKRKGIIIRFYDNKEPVYEYAPLNLTKTQFDIWYNETMEKNKELTWIENIYWYLEDISIVLVTRNQKWYNAALPKMIDTWNIILKERKEGYDHRKPNKRVKKPKIVKQSVDTMEPVATSGGVNFQHSVSTDDSDISSDNFNFSYLSQKKSNKVIIKINTEPM